MADNKDQGLDADILQARMDIQRIRQSILDSRSGRLAGEEVRAVDSAAGLKAEIETKSTEPEVKVEERVEEKIEIPNLPVVDESPAIEEVVESADLKFEPVEEQEEIVTPVPAAEEPQIQMQEPEAQIQEPEEQGDKKADSENQYAVTKDEIDALLKDESDTSEHDDQVAEEVLGQVSPVIGESQGESHDDGEMAEIIAEAEEWMKTVAPDEKSEISAPEPEAVAAEPEVSPVTGALQEAQDEAIEEVKDASVQESLPVIDVQKCDDEGMVTGEGFGEVQEEIGFDEVVSDLQGEELIVPVEAAAAWEEELGLEIPQEEIISSEAAKAEELETAIGVIPVEIGAVAASQISEAQEMDVQLRIIKDIKEEGEKSDGERAGIPRLNLSESALGEVAEARKNASATRKRLGKKEKLETPSSKPETVEEKSEISNLKSKTEEDRGQGSGARGREEDSGQEEKIETAATPPVVPASPVVAAVTTTPTVAVQSDEDRAKQEKGKRIVAQIVTKDIERLCAIAAAHARQKDVTIKR